MNNRKSHIPFSYKIMIPYLLLVLLTETFIGTFTYLRMSRSSTEMTDLNMKMTFQQSINNISFQLEDAQQISDTLFQSTEIQRYLLSAGSPFDMYKISEEQLLPMLATPLSLTRNSIQLSLYVNNQSFNEVFKDVKGEIHERSYNLLYMSRIKGSDWFQEMTGNNIDNVWMKVETDGEQGNISLVRKFISFNDFETELGYLRISIRLEDVFQALEHVKIGEDSITRVKNKTTEEVMYQVDFNNVESSSDSYLAMKEDIPGTDLELEILVNKEYFLKEARNIRNVTITVCVASFTIMLVIGFFVAKLSNRKMDKIVSFVRNVKDGEFRKRIHIPGQDEFSQIAFAFNQMAEDMDHLIRTVYMQEIHVKNAELEALQAQINPHFLYNTLSTINSLANLGRTEQLGEMVQGLAKFYRLTLNDGRSLISLRHELEQAEAYIQIQKIKYNDRLHVNFINEEELLEIEVPKLIIQPLVENAIKHAYCGTKLTINIIAKREGDHFSISVIDNGIGMTRQRLREVDSRNQMANDSGCGIRNVRDRIGIRYNSQNGMMMGSIYGGGTTVKLSLPINSIVDS